MFGSRVILNGTLLGDHPGSFTPARFDARAALRPGENEVLIRVGAFRDAVPKSVPSGWDYEKMLYIPGIFDSVELILSGSPHIVRVQAVPDIQKQAVVVRAWVNPAVAVTKLHFTVREASSGQVVGEGDCQIPAARSDAEPEGQATIAIRDCHLWSPEDPFLYELEARGEADALTTRFGMRSFRLNPATGRAILNGRPYFMRGSNVTLYRFFEDSERGEKPWREEWVRRLHKAFRDMHWNSLRYCIGFPPEAWYRIADEEGFLIQDEFPIWNAADRPGLYDVGELTREYTEWMQRALESSLRGDLGRLQRDQLAGNRQGPGAGARAGFVEPALGQRLRAPRPAGRRKGRAPLSLRQPEISVRRRSRGIRARPDGGRVKMR